MTNEERTITDKRTEITRAASNGRYQDADDILSAFADEIRRECQKEHNIMYNALVYLACLGNGHSWGNSEGNRIAQDALKAIIGKEAGG